MKPAVPVPPPIMAAVVGRRSAPLSCGGSPDQVGEGDVEGVGDEEQVFQVGDAVRVLPAVDSAMVSADAVAELKLSEPGVLARIA